MVINHNIAALNTLSNLQKNTAATQDSLQKLSTGSKINKAADDASGLAISQKMQAQINGLNQSQENVSNGNSLIQTAEGALGNVQDILQKVRTLAVQAQNDTQNNTDKSNLQDQANALAQEINRISTQTAYNTKNVFGQVDGQGLFSTNGLQIQIGADSGQTIALSLGSTVANTTTLVSATANAAGATVTLTGDAASGYEATIGSATYSVNLVTSGTATYANLTDAEGNAIKDSANLANDLALTVTTQSDGSQTFKAFQNLATYTLNYDLTGAEGGTAGTAIAATNVTKFQGAQGTAGVAVNDAAAFVNGAANVTVHGVTYAAALTDASGVATGTNPGANTAVYFTLTDLNGNEVKDADGNAELFTASYDSGTGKISTGADQNITITGSTSVTLGTSAYTATYVAAAAGSVNYTLLDANGQYVQDATGATATFTGTLVAATVGTNATLADANKIDISKQDSFLSAVNVAALKVGSGTGESATAISLTGTNAINTIQTAIDTVSKLRSKLGAYQNRLSYAGDTLNIESQNLTAAQSTLTDTDVAQEMMNYTKNNILVQSAQAMLAQANQLPQGMLSLLKS